jgi:hypothetical protein
MRLFDPCAGGCTCDTPGALVKFGGWEEILQGVIPQWPGIHDVFKVLQRCK